MKAGSNVLVARLIFLPWLFVAVSSIGLLGQQGTDFSGSWVLEESCRQRIEYLTLPLEGSPLPMPTPVPVTVGGATVFALPVEHFEEL